MRGYLLDTNACTVYLRTRQNAVRTRLREMRPRLSGSAPWSR